MRITWMVLGAAVLATAAGCDGATGPDGGGTLEFAAVGDGAGAAEAAAPSYALMGQSEAEGEVEFAARAWVRTEGGDWLEVTPGAAGAAVVRASSGAAAEVFARAELPEGRYDRARVTFERVEANVTRGITIGVGNVIEGRVSVEVGGGATVERSVEVEIATHGTTRVLLDLNAGSWLSRADAEARTVGRADFESAVAIQAAARSGS